jgi:hypothetical protein
MNRRAFVPINRMRAGHSSLKASLSRFNFVSTAESESADGLQTEEHIFWDCKRYEEQRATMRDVLYENSKIEYPKSFTETAMIRENNMLQRAGWALPRPFLYIHLFFQNKNGYVYHITIVTCY